MASRNGVLCAFGQGHVLSQGVVGRAERGEQRGIQAVVPHAWILFRVTAVGTLVVAPAAAPWCPRRCCNRTGGQPLAVQPHVGVSPPLCRGVSEHRCGLRFPDSATAVAAAATRRGAVVCMCCIVYV